MSGEIALDTSTAIRYLNQDSSVVAQVTAELTVVLPLTVVGELLFGAEYAVLGIPEYWIVDPLQEVITVCILVEGFYDAMTYSGEERIIAPTFPELDVNAKQVLIGK